MLPRTESYPPPPEAEACLGSSKRRNTCVGVATSSSAASADKDALACAMVRADGAEADVRGLRLENELLQGELQNVKCQVPPQITYGINQLSKNLVSQMKKTSAMRNQNEVLKHDLLVQADNHLKELQDLDCARLNPAEMAAAEAGFDASLAEVMAGGADLPANELMDMLTTAFEALKR